MKHPIPRRRAVRRVRKLLSREGLIQRVAGVNTAASSPEFATRLNVLVRDFDGKPVTEHQVRAMAQRVLAEMGVNHDGVAITVQWFPEKLQLVLRARPEHKAVAAIVAKAKVRPGSSLKVVSQKPGEASQ